MKTIIAMVVLLSGCSSDKAFRKNVEKLIDCEYKYANKNGLTCQQIMDLQTGCYSLYQMRSRP